MSHGRNDKIKPMGFYAAALKYTSGLSPEASSNFTTLVKDVAHQYDYSDSAALNTLKSRLKTAAGRRKTRQWAQEVLDFLATKKQRTRPGGLIA